MSVCGPFPSDFVLDLRLQLEAMYTDDESQVRRSLQSDRRDVVLGFLGLPRQVICDAKILFLPFLMDMKVETLKKRQSVPLHGVLWQSKVCFPQSTLAKGSEGA